MPSAIRVLVIDDNKRHATTTAEALEALGYDVTVETNPRVALKAIRSGDIDIVLTDLVMGALGGMDILRGAKRHDPDIEIVMITGHGSIENAVAAMQAGAATYLTKPINVKELRAVVKRAAEAVTLRRENRRLAAALKERSSVNALIGNSECMRALRELIIQIAPTTATILITGESGTGKELVARATHGGSPRKDKPFVALNTSALSPSLLESELFGHVKGAFTGADSERVGRFAFADGGTLFLDEIGDLPLEMQIKLLRVLDEKQITPVGSNEPVEIDVRLVAATNRDLESLVKEGKFREDLYYRLNVVAVDVSPLRKRAEDVPLLATAFIAEFAEEHAKPVRGIDPGVSAAMADYDWPGNVRELRNAIENMVVLCRSEVLTVDVLPAQLRASSAAARKHGRDGSRGGSKTRPYNDRATLEEAEKELILEALETEEGNRQRAARRLGIGERTLYRKIKKYGLQ
ncbi:MAG: sigma-54-dependent Fis family transcriptional regulator [Planctomycetota bacterium]|nr:MAG: sigma-54-dependent Fis family transcriptional regulator [Planctomycetota bacterium]